MVVHNLRWLGLPNQIVDNSNLDSNKFEWWNPSDSKSDDEIWFWFRDDFDLTHFWLKFDKKI